MADLLEQKIDVCHLGRERVICAWRVGEVLIDPGPAVSLDPVLETFGEQGPSAILLTHIHLDHAGGTGTLVARWPRVPVYVHRRGARHLKDPTRLIDSATRLYGDQMETLWGEFLPVPEQNLRPLEGGERVAGFEVAYTPGHASHHVSYLHLDGGRAFTGDTAGVRIEPESFILAPTPPPDIDLELWNRSLDQIECWQPTGLGITHFGAVDDDPSEHLARFRETLNSWAEQARRTDAAGYERFVRDSIAAATTPEGAAAYAQGAPPSHLHAGLTRYWEKREAGGAG